MKTKQAQPTYRIIQEGIDSLRERIGPKGIIEFFRFFYSGKGDSVKEFKKMWKGMGIEEIHQEVLRAKQRKEI